LRYHGGRDKYRGLRKGRLGNFGSAISWSPNFKISQYVE
jgi:hypothetical protein